MINPTPAETFLQQFIGKPIEGSVIESASCSVITRGTATMSSFYLCATCPGTASLLAGVGDTIDEAFIHLSERIRQNKARLEMFRSKIEPDSETTPSDLT